MAVWDEVMQCPGDESAELHIFRWQMFGDKMSRDELSYNLLRKGIKGKKNQNKKDVRKGEVVEDG